MKHIILASASVLAITAIPAFAQTAPAADADDSTGLADIIVTAQRTSESAQKAPIAIAVVQPEELTRLNITRAEDLTRIVPALVSTASGGPNTTFFIRGVGNTTSNSYSDPAISFNYDGVAIGRPNSTQGFFFDLQRVEVLKGPQGTLYGRNATGGAINVIPVRPKIGQLGAEFQASYGNYNAYQSQGAINVPIGDHGAFRLSGFSSSHDGYLSDGTSDQKQYSIRGQVLAELTPNLTMRVAADVTHQGGAGVGTYIYGTFGLNSTNNGYVFTPTPTLGSTVGVHDPRTEAFVQTRFIGQAGRVSEATGSYPFLDVTNWGVTNETNWTTDSGTLTVQAAYRESTLHTLSTTSNFRGFFQDEKTNQVTLEARYAGKLGTAVDYLIGGFLSDESINAKAVINQIVVTPFQNYKTGTNSKAAFGKLSLHATDTITLTAAGRYTSDYKRMNGLSNVYTFNCGNPNLPPPNPNRCPNTPLMPLFRTAAELVAFYTARGVPVANNPPEAAVVTQPPAILNSPRILNSQILINSGLKTDKFTYRLAADWQVTPSNLLYASYETGYHGGGFNFGKGRETYNPETIEAYTIGSKNRFFGNKVQLNIEAFYWKYRDQQIAQFGNDFSNPPISVFYTSNIGRSTIKGVDVDLDIAATPTTRISGSVQYLDTNYDSYAFTTSPRGPYPNFNNCRITLGTVGATPALDVPTAIDCSGNPALFSPKWSFNINLEQTIKLDGFKLIAAGGTRWRGDFFAATSFQPWTISKAAFQSDASLTLAPDSDRWFISAFVNNIEDERRISQSNLNNSLSTQSAVATAPRTYGVRIGAKF